MPRARSSLAAARLLCPAAHTSRYLPSTSSPESPYSRVRIGMCRALPHGDDDIALRRRGIERGEGDFECFRLHGRILLSNIDVHAGSAAALGCTLRAQPGARERE